MGSGSFVANEFADSIADLCLAAVAKPSRFQAERRVVAEPIALKQKP